MFEELLRLLGYGLCHQLPERSLFGGGIQLPVCARDTGIYIGFAVALIVLWVIDRGRKSSEIPPWWASVTLGLFIVAMAIDGFTSYAGLRTTTNELRLLTGLMTGFAMAAFTVPLLNSQLWAAPGRGRAIRGPREFGLYVGTIGLAYALVWWVGPLLGPVYPALTAVCILVTFTAVNGVIVALLPPFERKAHTLSGTWPVFVVALGITFGELAAVAALRIWAERAAGLLS